MARVPRSERTRNELKEMFAGKRGTDRSGLVRQAARLIVEEALEAYVARRTAEGMSNKEIHRCLKRYIVRELTR